MMVNTIMKETGGHELGQLTEDITCYRCELKAIQKRYQDLLVAWGE